MKDPIVLKVYRGDRLVAVKQFLSPQIVIGRQSDAGLSLDDEKVSPLHAVIDKREDGYYVSDLGSEAGIAIEGTSVLEAMIKEGESLEVGPYTIRFYEGVPKPAVKPDFKKTHIKPEVEKREIVETRVEEIELDDDVVEAPPEETPSFDSVEANNNASFSENDPEEATVPNFNAGVEATHPTFDENKPKEDSQPGVVIKNRKIEDSIRAQNLEPFSGGYIAPVSNYSNVDEIINPYSRGSVLEVVIAWQERVLNTYHFSNQRQIYISNVESSDVYVPLSGGLLKHRLISFSDECVVHVAKSMQGELYYDNKSEKLDALTAKSSFLTPSAEGKELKLDQGEMVKLDLMSDNIFAYVRFVEDTPKAAKTPVFDFSMSELIGIFMSFASIGVIAMYMLFYVPSTLENTQDLLEDRLKKAVITFTPPPKVDIPKVASPPPPELEKKVVKVAEKKAPKKVVAQKKAGGKKAGLKSKDTGKPKAAAPSRVKTKNNAGSSRPGGSVKTGKKAANMETQKKDVTKTGLLSALSGGGKNSVLDKASSGVGTTIGTADSKTGYQGQLSDQKGTGIGTKLQAGKGGQGSSLAGVGDLSTSGRGGGDGYGTSGLGGKGNSTIVGVDGVDAEFSSNIDMEAIRRLIRKNKNAIRGCYERALTQNANQSGKVVLGWKITNGGKMISPKVISSTLNNPQVEKCVISRLMVLTFPDPGPGEIAEITFPFVFNRSN